MKVSRTTALICFGCAAVCLGGCEPGSHLVRPRAASDLSCHERDVEVHQTEVFRVTVPEPKGTALGFVWVAFGCGKRIEYVCHSENDDPFRGQYLCAVRSPPPRPPPPPTTEPVSVDR